MIRFILVFSPRLYVKQVEATGVEKLANDAINYVRRGGTLMIYGVYENAALVHWPPSKIFGDEINVRTSGNFFLSVTDAKEKNKTFLFPTCVFMQHTRS
jgi:threonine dehydrogenase-like Zn-dependent dehydrogenase